MLIVSFLSIAYVCAAAQGPQMDSILRVNGTQGCFLYKDYLVQLSNDGHAEAYNLKDGSVDARFDIASSKYKPHCNVANIMKRGLHTYLYTSEWNNGRRFFVERIRRDRAGRWNCTLEQIISTDAPDSLVGAGYMDWVIDAQNRKLYSVAYEQGGERNDYFYCGTVVVEYALPDPSEGDVVLHESDILRRKVLPSVRLTQDKEILDGKMYIGAGVRTRYRRNCDVDRLIAVVDVRKMELERIIDFGWYNEEIEGIDFRKGRMLLTFRKGICFDFDYAWTPEPAVSYSLDRVVGVEGRQGIATDGVKYYVSGSTALYAYGKDGRLLMSNTEPFEGLEKQANHIGDIDCHDGKLFAGIEYFMDGVGRNIQVAVYDAATLKYMYSIPWNAESGQREVCGLAVNPEHGHVWMADWTQGHELYCYSLASGEYVGKVALRPVPRLQQGICFVDGRMVISCDDGDAEADEADRLYFCNLYPGNDGRHLIQECGLPLTAETYTFRIMDDFLRVGEIEGLSMDPASGELLVLANRGARIILGMPRGFYEGYDCEIHEIYVYKIKK